MRFQFSRTILASLSLLRTNLTRSIATPAAASSIQRLQVLRASMPIPFIGSLFSSSTPAKMTNYPVQKTDQEWQAVLSPEQFRVIRQKGTEQAFTGEYDKHSPTAGTYNCAACDAPLYTAQHKFKSGCGWPAFFDAVPGAVERHTDRTFGMARTEIVCAKCGGHLGHVFAVSWFRRLLLSRYVNPLAQGEGYKTPTDERHCVNSVSIKFTDEDKVVDKQGDKSKV